VPAALLASGLVVATAATVLAATGHSTPATAQSCADGREWVTVYPMVFTNNWRPVNDASAGALLAGCVDTSRLPGQPQAPAARG
jgi:hypothetical protein